MEISAHVTKKRGTAEHHSELPKGIGTGYIESYLTKNHHEKKMLKQVQHDECPGTVTLNLFQGLSP